MVIWNTSAGTKKIIDRYGPVPRTAMPYSGEKVPPKNWPSCNSRAPVSSRPAVRFERATASQNTIVENLLQLYMHDMSEWFGTTTDERGRFSFIEYEPEDLIYLAFEEGLPAGVAIVTENAETDHELEEFFLMRRFRRRDNGERFAAHIWDEQPGNWVIRVFADNLPAAAFWPRVIGSYTDGFTTEKEDVSGFSWLQFRFNNENNSQTTNPSYLT